MERCQVNILVDYDNLGVYKPKSINDIVTLTLSRVLRYIGESRIHCLVRLYGGWFTKEGQSNEGKAVLVKLQGNEDIIETQVGKDGQRVVAKVHVEMASSILQKPECDLFFTYRTKARTYDLRVKKQEETECKHDSCLLPLLAKFLKTRKCPRDGCSVDEADLVWRNEQKLVDSMIVCDLLYSADVQVDYIVLVSDDDDFVPPLVALSVMNKNVIRISPKGAWNEMRFDYVIPGLKSETF